MSGLSIKWKNPSENPDMPHEKLRPVKKIALEFLHRLDPDATAFTFQTFDDDQDRKDPNLAGILHGSLAEHWTTLVELNKKGAGVFFTVNETNFKGRKGDDIVRIRALWHEDDEGNEPDFPIDPHIVVESSPNKFHRYFLTDLDQLDEFKAVQARLVQEYGSDPNASDISRVLRLPGFYHQKVSEKKSLDGTPHLVQIIYKSEEPPVDWKEIKKHFPPVEKDYSEQRASKNLRAIDNEIVEHLRSALRHYASVEVVGSGEAHADIYAPWVEIGLDLKSLGDDGFRLFDEFSRYSVKYDEQVTLEKWNSFKNPKSSYQNIFKKAQDVGWVNLNSQQKANTPHINKIQFIPISEVMNQYQHVDWLINGYLEAGTITTLISPPASYKTFLAIDWALCLAAGIDWKGHKVKCSRRVAFIIGEGFRGFQGRFKAWGLENEVDVKSLPVQVSDRAASLADNTKELLEALDSGESPELIIFDTLSRNAGPADENSTADMSKLVTHLDMIKARYDCAIVLVHHTPLNDPSRGRGSSVVYGATDFQYVLKANHHQLTIKCSKSKDHEPPKAKTLLVERVDFGIMDEHDGATGSLVLKEGCEISTSGLGNRQRALLDIIMEIAGENTCADGEADVNQPIVTRMALGKRADMPKQRLSEGLKTLESRASSSCKQRIFIFYPISKNILVTVRFHPLKGVWKPLPNCPTG